MKNWDNVDWIEAALWFVGFPLASVVWIFGGAWGISPLSAIWAMVVMSGGLAYGRTVEYGYNNPKLVLPAWLLDIGIWWAAQIILWWVSKAPEPRLYLVALPVIWLSALLLVGWFHQKIESHDH